MTSQAGTGVEIVSVRSAAWVLVPVVRSVTLVDAPLWTVAGALRQILTAESGLASLGIRGQAVSVARDLFVPGDELSFSMPRPCHRISVRTRIVRADHDGMASTLVAGPLEYLRHESDLRRSDPHESDPVAGGRITRITETVRWTTPLGWLGRILDATLLRLVVRLIVARRLRAVRRLAESWAPLPVVVGAAIVRGGRVLAQRRSFPAADAGRWELPGGRVERGEGEQDAVIRECREELGVDVVPTRRVGTDVPLPNGMLLRVYAAELTDSAETPCAVEHHEVRWLGAGDLNTVDWLDADQALLHSLRALLAG